MRSSLTRTRSYSLTFHTSLPPSPPFSLSALNTNPSSQVASDALLYASNAASSLSSSLRSRGGLSLLLASAASSLSSSAASGLGSFLEPGKAGGVALLDAANSAIASKVNDGTVDWIYQSAPARLIRKQVRPKPARVRGFRASCAPVDSTPVAQSQRGEGRRVSALPTDG